MIEDYFQRQINQLGDVLAKALAKIVGVKQQGKQTEIISIADETLIQEIGFDIEKIILTTDDQFVSALKSQQNIDIKNLTTLADILIQVFEELKTVDEKEKMLNKIVAIYENIDIQESAFSLERHMKLVQIKNDLSLLRGESFK